MKWRIIRRHGVKSLFPFSFNINTGLLDKSIFEISNQDINKTITGIKK